MGEQDFKPIEVPSNVTFGNSGIRPYCINNLSNDPVNPETVIKAQNGDDQAFSKLFWQTYRYVFSISRQYLRREEDIYDAIQETYTNVYANLGKLKAPEAFVTWVGRIAVTCSRSMAEKMAATRADTIDDEFVEIDDTANDPKIEVTVDVTAVLSQMDPQDVELLTFVYYDRLKVTEIARMQGVPVTTVYSRLNAAKSRLKELLKIRGIEKAVYGGDVVTIITTALRNAIGTNLLSMAVAAEILQSVVGKETKTATVVAAVARQQRNTAALKIASLLLAATVLIFGVIAILLYWISQAEQPHSTSSDGITAEASGSSQISVNSHYTSFDIEDMIGMLSSSLLPSTPDNTVSGDTSSEDTSSTHTSGDIGGTNNFESDYSSTESNVTSSSADTSYQKPSSTVSTTAPSSNPSASSSLDSSDQASTSQPADLVQVWSYKAVSGGVEIIGLSTENLSGIYEIPSQIDGKTVVGIGNKAFYYESGIKSITLPETLQYIGEQAFANCRGITSIVIPSSVTEIKTNAFTECSVLSDVYIKSANITVASYAFSTMYQRNVSLTIYAPLSANLATKAVFNWDAEYVEWYG